MTAISETHASKHDRNELGTNCAEVTTRLLSDEELAEVAGGNTPASYIGPTSQSDDDVG